MIGIIFEFSCILFYRKINSLRNDYNFGEQFLENNSLQNLKLIFHISYNCYLFWQFFTVLDIKCLDNWWHQIPKIKSINKVHLKLNYKIIHWIPEAQLSNRQLLVILKLLMIDKKKSRKIKILFFYVSGFKFLNSESINWFLRSTWQNEKMNCT